MKESTKNHEKIIEKYWKS